MSYVITALASFILGAITGYLVLRNNPRVKAALDSVRR